MLTKHLAYEGNDPFIFISYAHKDFDRVQPLISELQSRGFRVWYDSGLEVGDHWHVNIADHLQRCECFIAFLSKSYLDSDNCQQEINYALNKKRDILPIYLEQIKLPLGLDMQLGLIHPLSFSETDPIRFIDRVTKSKKIQKCRHVEARASKSDSQELNTFSDRDPNPPFKKNLRPYCMPPLHIAVTWYRSFYQWE